MNHIGLFFNTEIQDSGFLSAIGDFGLTPVRYLFNGNTVLIEKDDSTTEVHHVESFHHKEPHFSKSTMTLTSSSTGMLTCIGMIVGLVPGFFLCIFKVFAYFSADMREDHRLAKLHFTPIDRTIGSSESPITTRDEINSSLFRERKKPLHRLTNILTIHGDGNLEVKSLFGKDLYSLNPRKIILEGATIGDRTDDYILGWLKTSKWKLINRTTDSDAPTTLDEARDYTPPAKGWFTFDRWRVLIEIPRPTLDSLD